MSTKKSRLKQATLKDTQEEDNEDNEEQLRLEKIKAPLIWGNMPKGFVIQDLPEKRYNEIPAFFDEHYLDNDILCRCTYIKEDPESLDSFLKQISVLLNDKCSICAIHEETKEIAGVLILRVLHQCDFGKVYSRVKMKYGEAYRKICQIAAFLNRKTDIFGLYNCDKFLRCYFLAVSEKYRHKGIGFQLLRAAIHVARSLNIDVIMGIFNSNRLQVRAKKVGMETINEIYYVDWVEKGEMVFDDPGAGNYTVSLMAGKVLPLT